MESEQLEFFSTDDIVVHLSKTPGDLPKIRHATAVLCLIGTGFLWSLGGVLIKSISWNPLAIAGTRSLIALPFLQHPYTWPF